MGVAPKTIKEITGTSLDDSLRIIRSAFGKVASELGVTPEKAPMFPAFITLERLEEMQTRGARFFGIFLGGKQVGVVAIEKRDTRDHDIPAGYFMERLAVLPEHWHAGIGRELVGFVIGYVRKMGVKKLYLGMVNEQTVLKEWYRSQGFEVIGVQKFEHLPLTVCFMELNIA